MIDMKRTLFFLISIPFSIIATVSFLKAQSDSVSTHSKVYIEVKANGFFDNLEFFNNIQKGYTLTGFNLEPTFGCHFAQGSRVSAGFHLLQFAGQSEIHRIVPVLTLNTKLNHWLNVVLGTLDISMRKNIPEPIFKPERLMTHLPETGLQLLISTVPFCGETWINWEKMIFPNDTLQEEFTVGFSGKFLVSSSGLKTHIPFYALAVHQGGQINNTSKPVSTLTNFGTGINLSYNLGKNAYGFEPLIFWSRDGSPNPHHAFKKGWAMYPKLYFNSNNLKVELGYWYARQMILPRGQEVYGSISLVDPSFNSPHRKLITSQIEYSRFLVKGFAFTSFFKLYYDLNENLADYRFGVIVNFNHKQSLMGFNN